MHDSCTEEQLIVIAETVESLKASLDKHMSNEWLEPVTDEEYDRLS